jgi:hypothetical protein
MVPGMSDEKKPADNQSVNDWMTGKGNKYMLAVGALLIVGFLLVGFGL